MKTTKSNAKQSREYLRQHPTYTATEIENFGYSKTRAQEIAADPSKNWKAANGGQRTENPTLAAVKPVCSDLTDPGDWLNPEAVKLVGARIAELEKQKATLLAALEKILPLFVTRKEFSVEYPALVQARAAIAAARQN